MSQVIGNYVLESPLGSGASSKVKLAHHSETGQQFAIKIIKTTGNTDIGRIRHEIALMRLLNHPNVLRLVDVLESQKHIFMVENYAKNGCLEDIIQCITIDVAITFFRQIIYGLEYLHQHGICHRDLKPANILLDFTNQIWIADFGFATWMSDSVVRTPCGSPVYTAPEVLKGLPYDGKAADIWSIGVILYNMLSHTLPFSGESVRECTRKIKSGKYVMPRLPSELQDLIHRILVVNPEQRISLSEIKRHPAFRIGLPNEYQLPVPLPLPNILDPIDIEPEIVEALSQIGFQSTDQIQDLLSSDTSNWAKVFYTMMIGEQSYEHLFYDPIDGTSFNEISISSFGNFDTDTFSVSISDSLERAKPWITCNEDGLDKERTIQHVSLCAVDLMLKLQQLFTFNSFQFYYPDECSIIVQENIGMSIFIIEAKYNSMTDMSVKIQEIRGNLIDFDRIYDMIVRAIE